MNTLTNRDINKLIALVSSAIDSLKLAISMRWGVPARDQVTLDYYESLLAKIEAMKAVE